MTSLDEYRAILSGEARYVDMAAVEQELTQLWKAAAEDTIEGQPVVRACVLNLVAYAPDGEVAQHMNDVLAHVSGRHPSRAIIIVAEKGGGPGLRASISAHCQVPTEGGKQVCSEQITFHASGEALSEAHGSVLPLLVPDLPVFLWWHGEPDLHSHLFQELLENADCLVVDSADFASERAAPLLADLRRAAERAGVALSDLNWSRLTQWRDLVAQFFDAQPGRQYLDRLDTICVEIASIHGRNPDLTEGLLLIGWLASRLRWSLVDGVRQPPDRPMTLRLASAAGDVEVELRPDPDHPGEGLHSVALTAGDEASFSVTRKPDEEHCVVVSADLPEGAANPRVIHMDLPAEARLLCEELDILGGDFVFEEALAQAVQLIDERS